MVKLRVKLLLVGTTLILSACAPAAQNSSLECALATKTEWQKDTEITRTMAEGFGPVYDSYTKLKWKGKSNRPHSCAMEGIVCPAPHEKEMGCQIIKCEVQETAGALLRAEDYQGERYFMVEQGNMVRWDGHTFNCTPS